MKTMKLDRDQRRNSPFFSTKKRYKSFFWVFSSFLISFELEVCAFNVRQARRGHYASKLYESAVNGESDWDALSTIDDVERVFAISDLHTDNISNLKWLEDLCSTHNRENNIRPNDAIIIAGDISHELSKLNETLCIIKENLDCQIFFVWGNHEAWIGGQEMDSLGIESSLQKIELVKLLCHKLGVHTDCKLVGTSNDSPVFIMPIESWYDATLSLNKCEDLCTSFDSWRWVDFMRCVWPDANTLQSASSKMKMSRNTYQPQNTGKIPLGLTELLINENKKSIKEVQEIYFKWIQKNLVMEENTENNNNYEAPPGLITFSHFLPNQQTLPDWKDPSSNTFLRTEWLDHPVPDISAKFAKVAGSILIDEQIRDIIPHDRVPGRMSKILQSVQHLHVFGHSHRPKDFVLDGIRYIHNPLGKPAEREMNMVSPNVGFQLIWDCTNQSSVHRNDILDKVNDSSSKDQISSVGIDTGTIGGEIPGTQIIRYWEEKGGGKEALARRMRQSKRRRRIAVKRALRELELSKQVETPESRD